MSGTEEAPTVTHRGPGEAGRSETGQDTRRSQNRERQPQTVTGYHSPKTRRSRRRGHRTHHRDTGNAGSILSNPPLRSCRCDALRAARMHGSGSGYVGVRLTVAGARDGAGHAEPGQRYI